MRRLAQSLVLAVANSVNYHTALDLAEAGYKSWGFASSGLLFVVLGILFVLGRRRLPGAKAWPFFFLGFAVLWTSSAFYSTYTEYENLRTTYEGGNAKVVEGNVSRFEPMPWSGHARERFCVDNQCFDYSDFNVTSGFNNTSSHGGPIRDGLRVRVTYVGDAIVKLEVAK